MKVSNEQIPTSMSFLDYAKKGTAVIGTIAGPIIYHQNLLESFDVALGFNASPWVGVALTAVSASLFYQTLGHQQPKILEESKSTDSSDSDDEELLSLSGLFFEPEKKEPLALIDLDDKSNVKQASTHSDQEMEICSEHLEYLGYKGIAAAEKYRSSVETLHNKLLESTQPAWQDKNVLKAADSLMKLAKKISDGLPDYLPNFLERLEKHGISQSVTDALTQEENELYPTAYYLPFIYHMIRPGVCKKGDMGGLQVPRRIAQTTSSPFYQEGTLQSEWRSMYNAYCEKMRQLLEPGSDLWNILEPDLEEKYKKTERVLYPKKVTQPFDHFFKYSQ